MSEHNPSAWQNGFDAWQCGYDDAMYDGVDMASELPCQCAHCLSEYERGQEDAIKEIFANSQSAQQSVQADICPECGVEQSVGDTNNIRGGLVCGTCGKCR